MELNVFMLCVQNTCSIHIESCWLYAITHFMFYYNQWVGILWRDVNNGRRCVQSPPSWRDVCLVSTLVRISRTIFLTAALRKTEATPRHNNKGKNVYSILPCLREMNRINRHFVYISIDTTYNRFPYTIVLLKGGL
jgi:hypothetical protein